MIRSIHYLIIFFALILIISSCKKNWLDAKPNISLQIPTTIADYMAILDKTEGNGVSFNNNQNGWHEAAAGDFWLPQKYLDARENWEIEIYTWQKDKFYSDLTGNFSNWTYPYERIFYCNIVLEGIEKIRPSSSGDELDWNQVKGAALFFRAYNHYDIAQMFCKPYDKSNATKELGIPLRLEADFNIPSHRSTVEETYQQIITDLKKAAEVLPIATPINNIYKYRPTKVAANAMLARVFLSMEDYENALFYSEKALQQYDYLIDLNNPDEVKQDDQVYSTFPQIQDNKEILFVNTLLNSQIYTYNRIAIDSNLYNSYDDNDHRKLSFFRKLPSSSGAPENSYYFRGTYAGQNSTKFSGLATNELYLIRAECLARLGDIDKALETLNALLVKRWNTGTYVPYTDSNPENVLRIILTERRKELLLRGLRWSDLRRLNKDPRFAVTLERYVNNERHTLPPNDPRYVFPIPYNVIELTGMEQNPRTP
jgi:SusD family.